MLSFSPRFQGSRQDPKNRDIIKSKFIIIMYKMDIMDIIFD